VSSQICEDYCNTQSANCVGDDAIDFGTDGCLTTCAGYTEGASSDQGVDSAYCRDFHADLAASNASLHCPHASPSGGGVCVSSQICEDYCNTQSANCVGDDAIDFGTDGCLTTCAGYTEGTSNDTGADSAYCRLYHADLAASDASVHCPHASPGGGDVCVDSVTTTTTPAPLETTAAISSGSIGKIALGTVPFLIASLLI